ncbi:pentatricopeptide repeat-containing protein At3g50420 [Malania oleifera]|uniref:pentatricopeptide repeat-containing protein At3g50420 n=1 Tax=Malania oleifera TaxID=397392 RepID=UPI0025AEA869|nr:pentatricopeptide repeat-containing protein At3g50420 [Malania oleifera]
MPPLYLYEASALGINLVQRCISTTSLQIGRQLHAFILTSAPTYPQSPFLYNNILSMYARCGSLRDSHLVFDTMPLRSLVTFNALIAAYSRAPCNANTAFKVLAQMKNELCLGPNGATFTSLLQASSALEDRLVGSTLHSQVVKFGFSSDICVQTSLLGMYSNCGDLESANKVFSCAVCKDAVSWNSIIYGNMKNDKIRESLHLFGSMVRTGVIPTQFTYSMVLNACGRLGARKCGQLIHAQVVVSNTSADLPLQNSLLDMYCSCGDTPAAFNVFSRIENPDLVSWNSMIAGCSENGNGDKAMDLFNKLQRMPFAKPDEYTFVAVISASREFPASNYGKALHAQVGKEGFEGSVFVGSTLVSMYFKNGESDSAWKVFSSISRKDVVLWTEMITGYSRMMEGDNAIKFFLRMSQEGHKVDSFTLSAALSVCSDLATLRQGEMIHSRAVKTGYDAEMSVCGSLIDMYAKTGSLQAAQSIFSMVTDPDIKCWNSLLGGYSHHGKTEEALNIFGEILKQGQLPDHVTFVSLLAACSHCGLVDEGKLLWNYMKENGLIPGPKHYSCMVSLLSRAGMLEEAEEMIIESPFGEDYLELWRTLLSSCVINRNLKMGLRAAEQVLRLDSEDSATHILLSNLYAAEGRWDGVAEMRRKIRGLMLEKDPGLSWVEVTNKTHVFCSGDRSCPEANESQAELQRLQGNMPKTESNLNFMQDLLTCDVLGYYETGTKV